MAVARAQGQRGGGHGVVPACPGLSSLCQHRAAGGGTSKLLEPVGKKQVAERCAAWPCSPGTRASSTIRSIRREGREKQLCRGATSTPQGEAGTRRASSHHFASAKVQVTQKPPSMCTSASCSGGNVLPKGQKALQSCCKLSWLLLQHETAGLRCRQGQLQHGWDWSHPDQPDSPPPEAGAGDLGHTYRSTWPSLLLFYLQTQDIKDQTFVGPGPLPHWCSQRGFGGNWRWPVLIWRLHALSPQWFGHRFD